MEPKVLLVPLFPAAAAVCAAPPAPTVAMTDAGNVERRTYSSLYPPPPPPGELAVPLETLPPEPPPPHTCIRTRELGLSPAGLNQVFAPTVVKTVRKGALGNCLRPCREPGVRNILEVRCYTGNVDFFRSSNGRQRLDLQRVAT